MTDETNQGSMPFGHVLRAKRLAKKLGLRKFAELVGVSPTYVSQVEQCNVMPPTADRICTLGRHRRVGDQPLDTGAVDGRYAEEPVVAALLRQFRREGDEAVHVLAHRRTHHQRRSVAKNDVD